MSSVQAPSVSAPGQQGKPVATQSAERSGLGLYGRLPRRVIAVLGLAVFLIFSAGVSPAPIRAAWVQLALRVQLQNEAAPGSAGELTPQELGDLSEMAPQDQAEFLLQRAIGHDKSALDLIAKSVDGWYGQLELQSKLSSLLTTALNSNDLRVRAEALDVELAAYNLPKRAESAENLIRRIQNEPAARPWALWMLGVLGNRGVEPKKAFAVLMDHRRDPEEQTRYWAIEGLSMLGTDDTVRPLLEAFRSDPSPLVRERGACALSQSGMLTKAQRKRVIPDLLKMSEDENLDATMRGWVFQALRDITGASLGSEPSAWRNWWAQNRS